MQQLPRAAPAESRPAVTNLVVRDSYIATVNFEMILVIIIRSPYSVKGRSLSKGSCQESELGQEADAPEIDVVASGA